MDMVYRARERHPWVLAFLDAVGLADADVVTDVAAGDEMYRYLLAQRHGHRDRALVDYFRTGHAAASVLAGLVLGLGEGEPTGKSLLDPPFSKGRKLYSESVGRNQGGWDGGAPPLKKGETEGDFASVGDRGGEGFRILDFAAGWGRVTRFLVRLLPEVDWWVSDVSPGSVEFQRGAFGVQGFPSTVRPEDLEAPGRFDAIVVPSLFTHLPRATFGRWLARLWSLVGDGGVLIFSTHDVSTLPEGEHAEPDGFRFLERSEIDSLSKREYGETWVSEDYVAQRMAELQPKPTSASRLPRGLWHFQDLYVLSRDRELPALDFDPGPRGSLEAATLEDAQRLWLEGWVDDGTLEVTVNGCPRATVGDVERAGSERGWMARVEPPEGDFLRPTDLLQVTVTSPSGSIRVLHLSTIEDLQAEIRERDLRRELGAAQYELDRADRYLKGNAHVMYDLEQRIASMEASKFWKLREAWFRVKRALGLTEVD